MNLTFQDNCINIDWEHVANTLKTVGMMNFEAHLHKKAFENSRIVIFVFHASLLVGFGRAISDGVCEAAIYDVAVLPEYQGKGVGTLIIKSLIKRLPECNIILFAEPGKELFYTKFDFRKMRTGMALFREIETMRQAGFTE